MSYITVKDGTQIYYKDWGTKTGRTVVFSHAWPLSGKCCNFSDFAEKLPPSGFY